MKCLFIPKMKLWKPIEISDGKISTKKFIYSVEKK